MQKKPVKKGNKDNGIQKSVKILWAVVGIGFASFIIIFAAANFGVFGKLPSLQQLENPQANLATEIYADDGKTLMGKIYTENRVQVDYSNISKSVIDALISTEDVRFYEHSGIDPIALGRALKGFGNQGGASTITQQLAKSILHQQSGVFFLKRGIDKLKEWIVALKLERNFTKQEIIALYLNRVSWLNVYGIRNASLVYFQKEPSKLTPDESALLVGMLSGPGKYDPTRNPDAALSRRNLVLDRMVTNDVLSASQAAVFKKKPLGVNYKKVDESTGIAPYFRAVLTKTLLDWCSTHKDPKTGENYDLYRDGLKIYTTIDPKMQLYAEEAVIKHMTAMQKTFKAQLSKNVWKGHDDILNRAMKESERWKNMKSDGATVDEIKNSFSIPVKMKVFAWNKNREKDTVMTPLDSIKYSKEMMQTAFCAMDPVSGDIKAWVGGIDFKWFKYDHVTTNRQVGSTFKPILYTLALTDAGLTPETHLGDTSITLAHKTISGPGGTMAYCLAKSINVAAYELMSRIGPQKTAEFAHRCGINSDIPIVPSIALGSADIQLIEMMRAYTMFPNRGFNTEPIYLSKIEDRNGNVLESFQPEVKQVISESDAYTMYRMMQGVVDYGTGGAMRWKYGITSPMGAKTGTTNDNTDGWFMGYTPQLLAGVWVGCDDPFLHIPKYGTSGGSAMAMPEWAFFMQKVYSDKSLNIDPKAQFPIPSELNNNPIYADQNFNAIGQEGKGIDSADVQGNGDASDYSAPVDVPVESDFSKDIPKEQKAQAKESQGTMGPMNYNPDKKDTTKKDKEKSRKPASKTNKEGNDY